MSEEAIPLLERVKQHIAENVQPITEEFYALDAEKTDRWSWHPRQLELLEGAKNKAKASGLWNFFLPDADTGEGLKNLDYAYIAAELGKAPLASETLNCSAPDTGNMEVVAIAGSAEQKERWLTPLLAAQIRSGFAMTEPDVASSDATNISTSIVRDGDDYVINGRKWWITGAMNPDCAIFIVMGKTDPSADRHRQQSMILVPRDTPGVEIVRGMQVLGYDDHDHGGHAEMIFRDVRVPASNLIAGEGDGFFIAQARLGPGRIHHCMRSIGMAERAIELMCERVEERVTFGRPLADQGVIREWIARSRIEIEQLRLLTLKAAWLMDTVGVRGAHTEIQAIKIAAPITVQGILDRAMQAFGAMGLSQDTPLAAMFAGIRTLRLADGPDEVHLSALGKHEIKRQRERRASS
ncbi:MAG: acyl-CoA dehydrogenase family protein [Actinomycetota bacterium]